MPDSYKSHDGIVIWAKPGETLSEAEQEAAFAFLRNQIAARRAAGAADPRVPRSPDEDLDAAAESLMRHVFAAYPDHGIRLFLAWEWFNVVRRPGSPDAAKLERARRDLKTEMVKAELATLAKVVARKTNGAGR